MRDGWRPDPSSGRAVIPVGFLDEAVAMLPLVMGVMGASFWVFGLYRSVWRFASLADLVRIGQAVTRGTTLLLFLLFIFKRMAYVPRSLPLLFVIFQVLLLAGPRLFYRWFKDRRMDFGHGQRVLIVGAGRAIFMTIPEACQLIMQAAEIGQGGETFVLDMGEPINIRYLAEQMIRLAGREPGRDIPIVYTGLRPGEKLYEELFYESEAYAPTPHAKIRVARTGENLPANAEVGGEELSASNSVIPNAISSSSNHTARATASASAAANAASLPETHFSSPLADSVSSPLQSALAALPTALARGDETELAALLAVAVTDWRPPPTATMASTHL